MWYTLYYNVWYTLYYNVWYTLYYNVWYTLYYKVWYTLHENAWYTLYYNVWDTGIQTQAGTDRQRHRHAQDAGPDADADAVGHTYNVYNNIVVNYIIMDADPDADAGPGPDRQAGTEHIITEQITPLCITEQGTSLNHTIAHAVAPLKAGRQASSR